MEDHPDLMGDLTPLFQSFLIKEENISLPVLSCDDAINFQELARIFSNYRKLINLLESRVNGEENRLLSNYYRLFRIYIKCNEVGHIWKASWHFEGVFFQIKIEII